MDRGKMVARLVELDTQLITEEEGFLDEILYDGFIGYSQRSDKEIQAAYDERVGGIIMAKKTTKRKASKSCPQCGAGKYKLAILPDQVGKGIHQAMYCSECGYEE